MLKNAGEKSTKARGKIKEHLEMMRKEKERKKIVSKERDEDIDMGAILNENMVYEDRLSGSAERSRREREEYLQYHRQKVRELDLQNKQIFDIQRSMHSLQIPSYSQHSQFPIKSIPTSHNHQSNSQTDLIHPQDSKTLNYSHSQNNPTPRELNNYDDNLFELIEEINSQPYETSSYSESNTSRSEPISSQRTNDQFPPSRAYFNKINTEQSTDLYSTTDLRHLHEQDYSSTNYISTQRSVESNPTFRDSQHLPRLPSTISDLNPSFDPRHFISSQGSNLNTSLSTDRKKIQEFQTSQYRNSNTSQHSSKVYYPQKYY